MNAVMPTPARLLPLVNALVSRAAEAALGRTRLVNAPLREALRQRLAQPAGHSGSLLADPVLEAAFGHENISDTMAGLAASGLLHPDTLDALAQTVPLDPSDRDERNTMPHDRHPYTHQAEAWRTLRAEPPRCAVVSSGTGSGKTEAFLVPILDSLARERAAGGTRRLTGVRALMIYPLNALIASQRDRLADWTAPFGGDVRFCLYNGQTKEDVKAADAARTPWEVLDRRTLRADPPPVLVTNATMLEYMLVRPVDAPLLRRSQGRLRFVVLDEAHTYLGSQAAEMTLLLRRTLRAFGVEPEAVSFVATSATLGAAGDEEGTRRELRRFLARLAGADESRVDPIVGRRHVPPLHPGAYAGLADDRGAAAVRATLASHPESLSRLRALHPGVDVEAVLERGMAAEEPEAGRFLPLRLHLFHRAQVGVFACLDRACPGRAGTPLDHPDWPFGVISERNRAHCPACGGMMFEVRTCDDCGLPVLEAALGADARHLRRPVSAEVVDEFAPDGGEDEPGDDGGEAPEVADERVLLAAPGYRGGSAVHVVKATGTLPDQVPEGAVCLDRFPVLSCPCCGAGAANRMLFRPVRLGGPFFLGTAGNVLLDAAPQRAGTGLPHGGRQMITFTDNRQGTARFAASWQQESERNFVRARIWHALQDSQEGDPADAADLAKYDALLNNPAMPENAKATVRELADKLRRKQQAQSEGKRLPWHNIREELSKLLRHEVEMLRAWENLAPELANPDELAKLHLLGEFLRRPNRANSLETMGLAALRFPAIEKLGDAHLPPLLRSHGATAEDWQDYLHLVLTFFVRARSAVSITLRQALWVGQRVRAQMLMRPGLPAEARGGEIAWPLLRGVAGRASRPALMLRDGLNLNLDDPAVREDVNDALRAAWTVIQPLGQRGLGDGAFQLDLAQTEVAPVARAWRCPVTHRLLDRTFRGLSPFSSPIAGRRDLLKAEPLDMPRLPCPWPKNDHDREAVRAWLQTDYRIAELRRRGLWTDIADRLALLSPYARIVEHSAQQPGWRLRGYEAAFKRGQVNVLNCSTTMEMGVDIGGITTVAMANVPPSPASYRQRVGRAGRRGEALAIAFTYCPDTPVGWHAFDDPGRPLRQGIAPPRVALDSRTLAQRHVNALLLADFLARQRADLTRMEAGAFFGGEGTPPSTRLAEWLRTAVPGDPALQRDLSSLLRGIGLAAATDVADRAAEAMHGIAEVWQQERRELQADLDAATGPARTALELQIRRFDGEKLLGELVRQAFLPGHGFPTGVVPFVVAPVAKPTRPGGADEPDRGRSSHPTRTLDIAVREYAPGADVILDGAVHRSGGVTLNWKRPVDAGAVAEIQALTWFWQCKACGAAGEAVRRPDLCAACGGDGRLSRTRALRPGGFAADPDRALTNAMDWVERVPPPRALISCAGAPWVALGPALGRFRHAADGAVMAVSRGAGAHGYAICLSCGRAEPEHLPADQAPPLPPAMAGHTPLRPRRGNIRCDGGTGERAFAVQRHLALGHARRTEVFELQLDGLADETTAYTVAVAIREALCGRLGIERDEVLCDAAPAPGAMGDAWSVWLSDTASGGAGYAGAAGASLPDLLRAARRALECSNPGCERACPACLILRDTAAQAARLDRRAAATYLDELLPRLSLPLGIVVFGSPGERMASAPLPAELLHAMEATPGTALTLFLHGPAGAWDLPVWWGAVVAERLARAGRPVRLLAAPEALDKAGLGEVLGLRALQDRAGGGLAVAAWAHRPSPPTLLATVEDAGGVQGWAAIDADGCGVAALPPASVARGMLGAALGERTRLDLQDRADALRPTAHRLRIGLELNGPASAFGSRLWEALRGRAGIKAVLASCGRVQSVEYHDRYLRSPVSVRLLASVLKALGCPAGTSVTVVTTEARPDGRDVLPTALHHDWPDQAVRDAVLTQVLRGIGLSPTVQALPRAGTPHARTLLLNGEGATVELLLDQGFGFWRPARYTPFAFTAASGQQASDLAASVFQVAGERDRTTEVFIEAEARRTPRY